MSRDTDAAPPLFIPVSDGQAEEVVNNGALPPPRGAIRERWYT